MDKCALTQITAPIEKFAIATRKETCALKRFCFYAELLSKSYKMSSVNNNKRKMDGYPVLRKRAILKQMKKEFREE